jgi:RecJ-like exonuclease
VNFQDFLETAGKIAELIKNWEGVLQLAYYPTSDALIAAAIFGRTFYDLKQPFTLFLVETSLEATLTTRRGLPTIVIGPDHDELAQQDVDFPLIALVSSSDRQQTTSDAITVINPGEYGYLGLESSLAAVAYFVCSSLTENLDYIVQLPLIASQCHNFMADYVGLHDYIAQDAITGEAIVLSKKMGLLGSEIFGISDALLFSQHPFLPGLTGNERVITQLLTQSGIEVEIQNEYRKLSDLSKEEITELNSNLIVHLSHHKGHQEEQLVFIQTKTELMNQPSGSITNNTWDFAIAINDAVNRQQFTLALAVLLGNRSNKLDQLQKLYLEERKAVSISYQLLIDHKDEVHDLVALRYFSGDKKISWFNTAVTAAMGLSNGLVTPDLPFAVVSPGPDELSTIGIRASKSHNIGDGLTLILQQIIEETNISSEVSGSRLSAQLSVPSDQVEEILQLLNTKLHELES